MLTSNWCSIGKRKERDLLVSGYTHQQYNALIPGDIMKMILSFYDDVAYWHFDMEELDFYNFDYKQVLFGPKIRFGDVVFQCTLCPSGWSHKGCVQFYIEFDKEEMNGKLPKYIKSITAYLVIYCEQIEYEYRTPKVFLNIESAQGWPAYRIDDIKLNNFKSLNFGCFIELLRIETATNIPSPICNRYDQFFNKTHTISNESCCDWVVTDKLLKKFKNAKHSQGFYSPNFDNDTWCLSCSPFGIKSEYNGKFCIALKILKLPYNVKSIKVKHSIDITSDDGKFNVNICDTKTFDYHKKASRFTKELSEIGTFEDAKSLTCQCTVAVLNRIRFHDINESDDGDRRIDYHNDVHNRLILTL